MFGRSERGEVSQKTIVTLLALVCIVIMPLAAYKVINRSSNSLKPTRSTSSSSHWQYVIPTGSPSWSTLLICYSGGAGSSGIRPDLGAYSADMSPLGKVHNNAAETLAYTWKGIQRFRIVAITASGKMVVGQEYRGAPLVIKVKSPFPLERETVMFPNTPIKAIKKIELQYFTRQPIDLVDVPPSASQSIPGGKITMAGLADVTTDRAVMLGPDGSLILSKPAPIGARLSPLPKGKRLYEINFFATDSHPDINYALDQYDAKSIVRLYSQKARPNSNNTELSVSVVAPADAAAISLRFRVYRDISPTATLTPPNAVQSIVFKDIDLNPFRSQLARSTISST